MAPKKNRTRPKTLSHGRPTLARPAPSMSSRTTRTLIRTYHTLEKRRAKSLSEGDVAGALKISKEIEEHGGIAKYQRASLLGQANERGGDSSKILMDWLNNPRPSSALKGEVFLGRGSRSRMLEVGALSISNACSRSGLFDIERIDLNSQAEGISRQDFMERPLPKDYSEQFDIISLSLVLNYVPDAASRGEMLERTLKFLRSPPLEDGIDQRMQDMFPSLFLVLPISCVTNSRYLDEQRLEAIMESLGYVKVHVKLTNKLAYYLWRATALPPKKRAQFFKKVEVRTGKTRNNFAIVLK